MTDMTENVEKKIYTKDDTPDFWVSLKKEELKNFIEEIGRQFEESEEIINLGRVTRNARYLTMIDRGLKSMAEGKGHVVTDDELRRMIYGA